MLRKIPARRAVAGLGWTLQRPPRVMAVQGGGDVKRGSDGTEHTHVDLCAHTTHTHTLFQ